MHNQIKTDIKINSVINNGVRGYTIKCSLPTGAKRVCFPTWSDVNGQDDLIWYEGVVNNEKGEITIEVVNHNNDGGKYITHIYAYDKYNRMISCIGKTITMPTRTNIENLYLTNSTSGIIECSCYAPVGTDYIQYDIMSVNSGVGVKKFSYRVSSGSGYISKKFYKSVFNNSTGKYTFRLTAYNSKGNIIGSTVEKSSNMR